jgi:DNA-binding transcriptional LysR family regulator
MELRTLRYFVAVVEAGSVTAAARAEHVAQPSLSRQLRQLERSLGIALFDRRDGRLTLSAAGRQFLPAAQEVLSRAETAKEAAAGIAAGRLQNITIAAPGTTLTDVIAPFIATIGPADPLPAVREAVPRNIYAELNRGADLVIGTTPPPNRLAGLPLANLLVWAYVPAGHRWSNRRQIPLATLLQGATTAATPTTTLLVPTQDFHPRQALDRAVSDEGKGHPELLEFSNPQVAQALAAAGRGVAVVSDDPRFDLHQVRITTTTGPLHISLYAAWEPAHHAADVIKNLAQRLSDYCIIRYGPEARPRPL